MPNQTTTWASVWAAVRDRQRELRWTDAHLLKQCNISDTVYRNGRNKGIPLTRPDKVAGLEYGLGWQPGSVDAILGGGKPVVADMHPTTPAGRSAADTPSGMVAVSEYDERLDRFEKTQAEILDEIRAERAGRIRLEKLLMEKLRGGDTNANERGPGDGVQADSDPGRPGGRRNRRADPMPSTDRSV